MAESIGLDHAQGAVEGRMTMTPLETRSPAGEARQSDTRAATSAVRILVVEDEALTVMSLRAQLQSLGYEVVGAFSSGEAALNRVAELRPDLILMDIHLEGEMDGTEAADHIRRQFHLPVVYLSGQSSEEILDRAKVTEPYGYVLKPYDGRALKVAVEMALSKHRSDRAREEAEAEFRELATTDVLTGLKNRRAFREALANEFERSLRYVTPLSLLMIDIDRFKQVNDTFGHLGGDSVLHRVAQLIQGAVRSTDSVARYGGEEFAVILIQADSDTAMSMAERVRRAVEQQEWQDWRITVSVGVSSRTPAVHDGTELIAMADAALYEAKVGGRNRVAQSDGTNQSA